MTRKKRKHLRWLVSAREHLAEIVDYIARDSVQTVEEFAERIFGKVVLLQDAPYSGAICPYYRKARTLIHGNYVVYYTVHGDAVVVRAAVRGARLFRSYG